MTDSRITPNDLRFLPRLERERAPQTCACTVVENLDRLPAFGRHMLRQGAQDIFIERIS